MPLSLNGVDAASEGTRRWVGTSWCMYHRLMTRFSPSFWVTLMFLDLETFHNNTFPRYQLVL